jgi:hypothetical protein
MNFKKTIILAAVLCFLLLVFYLIESPRKAAKKPEHPLFLSGFNRAQAATVFLKSKAKGEVSLRKKTDGWAVEANNKTYAADPAAVDNLLDTAAKIRIESIVSQSPGKYQQFEVDAENGVDVRIDDAAQKSLAHFVVGKNGPDLFSTYLRLADAQQVVLASGMLKMAFERELKDWRKKTIFSLNQQEITGYQVTGDLQYHLQKTANGAWEMIAPEKFTPKKEIVEDCLKTFAALNAADFAEGRLQDFQLDKPAREITVTLKSGPARSLLIGKEKNAFQRFVKAADADTVYVLESYNLEKLSPSLAVLKLGEAAKAAAQAPANEKKQEPEVKKESAPRKKAAKPARTASGKKKTKQK